MKVNGKSYRTIWPTADNEAVEIIDQTKLPHIFSTLRLNTMRDAERAIRDMQVRGAPLIGVTGAYGVALSMCHHASDAVLEATCSVLLAARPTAVNLRWGVEKMRALLFPLPESERAAAARSFARFIRRKMTRSISSPTATRVGWPRWIGARHSRLSTPLSTRAFRCTYGWTKPVPAIRVPASPRGSSDSTACRIPSSWTTPAAI